MLMNRHAAIAQDPISKCIYFMSLLKGQKVEVWVDAAFHWLQEVEDDPIMIPVRSNAWKMMERRFKDSFINYAECERAQDALGKLRMTNDQLDEYVAAFETQVYRA